MKQLKKDDILVYTWGYDQTNNDFYQVLNVSKTGKTVEIRQIETRIESVSNSMSDNRLPIIDSFLKHEPVLKKRVIVSSYLKEICVRMSCGYADLWDGKAKNCTYYA